MFVPGKVQRNAMRKNFEAGLYEDYLHIEQMENVMSRKWGDVEQIELEEEVEIAVLGGEQGLGESLARCLQVCSWCYLTRDMSVPA